DEPWVRQSYLKLHMHKSTSKTIVDPQTLNRQPKHSNKQGYSITIDEQPVGAASIPLPVRNTRKPGAGLSPVIPSATAASMARSLPVLQATSERITRATAHIPLDTLLASHRKDNPRG